MSSGFYKYTIGYNKKIPILNFLVYLDNEELLKSYFNLIEYLGIK